MKIRRDHWAEGGDRRRWHPRMRRRRATVLDLREDPSDTDVDGGAGSSGPGQLPVDPAMAERMTEARRRREARREAEAELLRLRSRHWSGERLIEEGRPLPGGRPELEWWEHPDADPYAVLGIIPGATLEEASHARRRIASANHPDRVGGDDDVAAEGTRRMVAANAAYDRLKRALLPDHLEDHPVRVWSRPVRPSGSSTSPSGAAER